MHIKIFLGLICALFLLGSLVEGQSIGSNGPSSVFNDVNLADLLKSLNMTQDDLNKMQNEINNNNGATSNNNVNNQTTQTSTIKTLPFPVSTS